MDAARDHYAVLGVPRDASPEEINRAYRLLSRVWHPDTNKRDDAAERFDEINKAKEVLLNDELRAAYDREVAPTEISVSPASVNFGVLKIAGPSNEAEVVLSWIGKRPTNVTCNPSNKGWWELVGYDTHVAR